MKQGSAVKKQILNPSVKIPYQNYILLAILILGFIIRFFKIDSLPMYGDELTLVYDSYSILKTGSDQTGEYLPLTTKMGAGRPAGYVYASLPFVALFGPTEYAVRSLSLLSGLGMIFVLYLLGKEFFNNKVGLWAAFLTSISLWDIYLSRGGFEAHFALFMATLGIYSFLKYRYILMSVLWGLVIFTYPTFKLTLPLMFAVLVIYRGFKNTLWNKKFIVSVVILFVFGLVSLFESSKGLSEARFLSLSILTNSDVKENIIQLINEKRDLFDAGNIYGSVIYNKPVEYVRLLSEKYFENLSYDFLFLRGDRNPRHNPGEWGMLFLIELPVILYSLYILARNEKKKFLLLLTWILITPLATMTMGQTHALRSNFMLVPLILLSAFGMSRLQLKSKIFVMLLIFVQFFYVMSAVYFYAPNKFGSFWSLEAKEASLSAINSDKNAKYVLDASIDNIEFAYPVYARLDPKLVISQFGKYPKVYNNVVISDVEN